MMAPDKIVNFQENHEKGAQTYTPQVGKMMDSKLYNA